MRSCSAAAAPSARCWLLLLALLPVASVAAEPPRVSLSCTSSDEAAFFARVLDFADHYGFRYDGSTSNLAGRLSRADQFMLVTPHGNGSYRVEVFATGADQALADTSLWSAVQGFRRVVAPAAQCVRG